MITSVESHFQGDADYSPMGVDLKTLPPVMRGRVKALKNIQLDTIKVTCSMFYGM